MSQRNQAGGASGYCGRPSFSESQACLLDVQMCSVGSNKSGSSRLPIVRPIVFAFRSEEHTSELQSLMRISYAVLCLKKKKNTHMIYLRYSKQPQLNRRSKYNIN